MLLCLGRNAILRQCLIADRSAGTVHDMQCRQNWRRLAVLRSPSSWLKTFIGIQDTVVVDGSNYRLASHGTVSDQLWGSLLSSGVVCCLFDQDVLFLSRSCFAFLFRVVVSCVHAFIAHLFSVIVVIVILFYYNPFYVLDVFICLNIGFGSVPFATN